MKEGAGVLSVAGLNANKLIKLKVPAKIAKATPYLALFASILAVRYYFATQVDKGKGVYYNVYVVVNRNQAPFIFPTIGLVHAQ